MDPSLFLWVLARVAGLSAFATLCISLITGLALRTAVLDWLANNRALRSLHEYTAVLWLPLGGLHVLGLLLDGTARVRVPDLLVPFLMPYGRVALGLGTLALDIFVLVAVTGWLKRRLNSELWQWIHRLSYAGFGLLFLHAVLSGTDFSDPFVSALTWSAGTVIVLLSAARLLWGRLPA